jgi:hypothetical protein
MVKPIMQNSLRPTLPRPLNSPLPGKKRPSPLRVLLVSWLLFGCIGTLWSFASPLMSIPDEPADS